MKIIRIEAEDASQRMDKFLLKYFKNASSGFLHKMLRKKNITLNKGKAEGRELLKAGDEIYVFFSDETFEKMRGLNEQNGEYEQLKKLYSEYQPQVIRENEDFLVCNKPSGMRSQKMSPDDVSINEYLLSYLIHEGSLDFDSYSRFKPSVVNRLDTNTTGIILFAKTYPGAKRLTGEIRDREIQKYYLAVASGVIKENLDLDGFLKKDPVTNKVAVYQNADGQKEGDLERIITEIEPLFCDGCNTLVRVHLVTGKSHQIRAHLCSIGHPIIGDGKYGDESMNGKYAKLGVKSQLLHAYEVVIDGETITCPPPPVFKKVIDYGNLEFQRTQGIRL